MRQPAGVNVTGQHDGPRRDSKLTGKDSKLPKKVPSDLDSSHRPIIGFNSKRL